MQNQEKTSAKWLDVKKSYIYMYDEEFLKDEGKYEFAKDYNEEINKILKLYIEKYFNFNDDKQTWFDRIKDLAEEMGYAREVKEYQAESRKLERPCGRHKHSIKSCFN